MGYLSTQVGQIPADLLSCREHLKSLIRWHYKATASSLLSTDVAFYRRILEEVRELGICFLTPESFGEYTRSPPRPLNPRLCELIRSKIDRRSCVESIARFLGQLEKNFQEERVRFSTEPFDRVYVQDRAKIACPQDFYEFLYGLEMEPTEKEILMGKVKDFEEIIDRMLEGGSREQGEEAGLHRGLDSSESPIRDYYSNLGGRQPLETSRKSSVDSENHERQIRSLELDIENQAYQVESLQARLA